MFTPLMDFKDTGVYKEVFAMGYAEGRAEGVIKGLRKRVDLLERIFEAGQLPHARFVEERAALDARLAEAEAKLRALQKDD